MYIMPTVYRYPLTDMRQNAFHELSGYPKDSNLNKEYTFLDYCMEEDAATVMEKWNVLMAGTPVTFDMR
jgi:hypothetical protein